MKKWNLLSKKHEIMEKYLPMKVREAGAGVVVQWEGEPGEGAISWAELLEIGRAESDEVLTRRMEDQAVNMACMLVYTSGTTGGWVFDKLPKTDTKKRPPNMILIYASCS